MQLAARWIPRQAASPLRRPQFAAKSLFEHWAGDCRPSFKANEMRHLLRDEAGASAAEYALILSVIGAVIALSAMVLGNAISGAMNVATSTIGSCGGSC